MLKIRKEQMDALSIECNRNYEKRLLTEFRFRFMAANNPHAARICAMIDTMREKF